MEIELRYGDGRKQIKIPDHTDVTILKPAERSTVASIAHSLEETLANPLGPNHPINSFSSVRMFIPVSTRNTGSIRTTVRLSTAYTTACQGNLPTV